MTHFRFRHKRASYIRWRWRAAHRRAVAVVFPFAAAWYLPSTTMWRRTETVALAVESSHTLRVGDFVISEEGDPHLFGHPGIRY